MLNYCDNFVWVRNHNGMRGTLDINYFPRICAMRHKQVGRFHDIFIK